MTLSYATMGRLVGFAALLVASCAEEKRPGSSDCAEGDTACEESRQAAQCICPAVHKPVCGANGETYGNACEARCAKTPVAYEGECKAPAEDASAQCVCPAIYKPVCGSDGKTYGNACEAGCAKVAIAHEGECADAGSSAACKSNADCGKDICFPPTDTCQPACSIQCLVADPVCGTDGKTYGCGQPDAHCHGVEVASKGECPASCVCTKEYAPVCGADGKTYGNACMAKCAGVAIKQVGECPAQSACTTDKDCPHGFCDHGVTCAALGCPPPPPNRCTVCGDGSQLVCKALPQPCPGDQVREIVKGCYGQCVDRHACAASEGCSYGGNTYKVGASFPSSDGCNTCSCTAGGQVACTLRACACNYDKPDVTWAAKSPKQCQVVKFGCPTGKRPFFNDCGCGCEPDTK